MKNNIKIFANKIDNKTRKQLTILSNLPEYQDEKIRIMPDCHAGSGCTIGTTMTITDKVNPEFVGVDIGCGMLVIELLVLDVDINFVNLNNTINEYIPSGYNVHSKEENSFDFSDLRCKKHVNIKKGQKALGTLGGGNHFIEVDKDEDNNFYLIIHSGSRGIGYQVAKYYIDLLKNDKSDYKKREKKLIRKLKDRGQHKNIEKEIKKLKENYNFEDKKYLDGKDFDDYINDMKIMQRYASFNRQIMARVITSKMGLGEKNVFETIHNYIDTDNMILRKGAVSAREGEKLIIPLNMRDGCLLCVGKGNPDWNYSAPHGAGRIMSRSKAKRELLVSEFKTQMKGIYSSCVDEKHIDEAPNAYKSSKDIEQLIKPTVSIYSQLKPVFNFKG